MARHRVVTRALALAALLTLSSWTVAATAGAHVHVTADHAVRGDYALVTFQVPNESEKGVPTTKVTITLPGVASASTDVMAGWTATLDRDPASGAYRSVTFTAAPNAGIGASQFELFPLSIKLPDADSVSFPVAQTYADGTQVNWDQPPLPGGGEPDYPAPVLPLAAGPHEPAEHHATPTGTASPSVSAAPAADAQAPRQGGADNTARALAGGALLVAAIGVGVALARRRT
ncbi:nuclear export factor GLE1 [Mycolicibacterium aromaticivorans JS19b1 = JCM 16368]|uniref:Nuclear export factor GLE1 n=1 Tax=Mycolicibacterium aromaticivorans JS19b1 = JCM 16368 TaxID=1440774 RepID=A0A064CGG5_9MYCO|nr:YcnI family protein [Mycolicibacterium aromaticivorans]KDE99709.1 nuclear export factor GLE1 [Mycolicibacterium aromaticivorans JS19b1 = JCM 16368]